MQHERRDEIDNKEHTDRIQQQFSLASPKEMNARKRLDVRTFRVQHCSEER